MVIRITSTYFCAGIDTDLRIAAPILRYMKGWTIGEIDRYCCKKDWSLETLPNNPTTSELKKPQKH